MTALMLATKRVEKSWGRRQLWTGFANVAPDEAPVGEIWFETSGGNEPELLVKYLFTSEKLSVQVHPDDVDAQAAGFPRGKDEAWLILAADPEATIGIGPRATVSHATLRAAALDGSIEQIVDWKPVKAGDYFYTPAGTVHSIGAGITLIEVQQNVDLTYRLYDYGRPRDLHLDDGIAAADVTPFEAQPSAERISDERVILSEGPKFVLERWSGSTRTVRLPDGMRGWFIPVTGEGTADGLPWQAGQCVLLDGEVSVMASPGSDMLFAYPGDKRI